MSRNGPNASFLVTPCSNLEAGTAYPGMFSVILLRHPDKCCYNGPTLQHAMEKYIGQHLKIRKQM
jgi:hypothetical protein